MKMAVLTLSVRKDAVLGNFYCVSNKACHGGEAWAITETGLKSQHFDESIVFYLKTTET